MAFWNPLSLSCSSGSVPSAAGECSRKIAFPLGFKVAKIILRISSESAPTNVVTITLSYCDLGRLAGMGIKAWFSEGGQSQWTDQNSPNLSRSKFSTFGAFPPECSLILFDTSSTRPLPVVAQTNRMLSEAAICSIFDVFCCTELTSMLFRVAQSSIRCVVVVNPLCAVASLN